MIYCVKKKCYCTFIIVYTFHHDIPTDMEAVCCMTMITKVSSGLHGVLEYTGMTERQVNTSTCRKKSMSSRLILMFN